MTERYARQTYKNLLSGMGGSALIAQQLPAPNLAPNGDENTQIMSKNISLKQATLHASSSQNGTTISSSASLVAESSNGHQAIMTANSIVSSSSLAQLTNAFNTNASMRNALGDIGNRLGTAQFALNQNNKNVLANKQQVISNDDTGKHHHHQNLPQQPPVTIITNSGANNTCIMVDVDCEITNDEELVEEEDVDLAEESIVDIDVFDSDNTQLAAIYVKDIYNYLFKVEKNYRISPSFLEGKIVTTKMRAVLIDWLIQVHVKFHLLQETLYLCVQIIDAYLMAQDVPKMQLQLVGVTAMFVASKYEEMYVPAIDDFVYMTDNTYTKSEIRQMEISILKTLNFMFCKPLPLHFLRRFSKAGEADPKQHTLAKYFMELSLHDAEFSSMDPSYLAAAASCLSFRLLNGSTWNRTMEFYSSYKQADLLLGMQKIAKLIVKSQDPDYKYKAVTNKYVASKLMRISTIPELSSKYIKDLAAGGNGK